MLEINKFKGIIQSFHKLMLEADGQITEVKPSDDKWSLREIIGHLIDSASNNHQRFVRLQFDDLLGFPPYDGEKWVQAQKYNKMKWDELAALWYYYNLLLLNIIENTAPAAYSNVWVKEEAAIPLEHLIGDYYSHIELHIKHFRSRMQEVQES